MYLHKKEAEGDFIYTKNRAERLQEAHLEDWSHMAKSQEMLTVIGS